MVFIRKNYTFAQTSETMNCKSSTKVLITILCIVLIGSILCITQWNRWFYNPPEAAYSTPPTPDRITLSYGQDALHTRAISWRCDSTLATASVILATAKDTMQISAIGNIVNSRSGKSAFYRADLNKLSENTDYSYKIICGQQTTEWFHFSTPCDSSNLDFIFFGDLHHPTPDLQNMFTSVAAAHPQVAFWGFVGDMIERPTDAYWTGLYDCMNGVPAQTPIIACTGNHEYLKNVIKKIDARWVHTYGCPYNGPKFQEGRTFYIDFTNLRYIVIDTDGLQMPWNYCTTRKWLKNTLQNNDKKWTIVVMHHPIHSASAKRDNLLIRWTFNSLLKKYKADLVLQGHDHSYARTCSMQAQQSTTPVYIVQNSSDKNYKSKKDSHATKTAEGKRFYTLISLTQDQLHVKTIQVEGEKTIDYFYIQK